MTNPAPELKPCPFCGSTAEMIVVDNYDEEDHHFVRCSDRRCRASLEIRADHAENIRAETAIKAWNTRAYDHLAETNKKLVELLRTSYKIILQAKHDFAPTTTNSLADDHLRELKKMLDDLALAAAKGVADG